MATLQRPSSTTQITPQGPELSTLWTRLLTLPDRLPLSAARPSRSTTLPGAFRLPDLLYNSIRDLVRRGDLNGAHQAVEPALQKFGSGDNSAHAWLLRLAWADLLRLRGHTDEALEYLASAERYCPPNKDDVPSVAGLKKTRGYCFGHLGDYSSSHALMREAENLAKGAGLLELQCEIHQCQAMIFYLQRDYDSSERLFRLILENSEKVGGWYFRANGLWGIGKNLMIRNRFSEAMPWLEESLSIFQAAGARVPVAIVCSELAVCYLGLGDDEKSLELLENASAVQKNAGSVQNCLVVLANIGNVYLHRRDHLRAIEYYREALELARKIKDPVSIQKWSFNLKLAYARLQESVDHLSASTA